MLCQPPKPLSLALATLMVFVLALSSATAGAAPAKISGAAAAGQASCSACGEVPASTVDTACLQFCTGVPCLLALEVRSPTVGGAATRRATDRNRFGRATAPEPNPPRLRS